MTTNAENFKRWYSDVIDTLSANGDAGFVILIVTVPLLERYLREKSGVHEALSLNDRFYQELCQVFPSLTDLTQAREFWQVFRNGLLHQVTLSQQSQRGVRMPPGWLSGNAKMLEIINGEFWVDPKKFADRVINFIKGDFSTFEGAHSPNHTLPNTTGHTRTGSTAAPPSYLIPPPTGIMP